MWTVEEAKTQQKKERNSNISDGNRILETIIAQIQSSSHIQKVRLETTTQHETVIPKFPGQNHGNISDSSTSYISPVFPARILLYDLQSGRHETPVHSKPVQSLKEKLALCCKESGLGKLPHSSMICSSASSGCAIHPPASIPLPFFTSIACVGHVHCLIRRLRLRLPTLPLSRTISVWRTCKVTNKKKKSTRAQGRALLPRNFLQVTRPNARHLQVAIELNISPPMETPLSRYFCWESSARNLGDLKPAFNRILSDFTSQQNWPTSNVNVVIPNVEVKSFSLLPKWSFLKISSQFQDWCPSMSQYPSFVDLA